MDDASQGHEDHEGIRVTVPRELDLVGERRELKLAGIRVAGRRRSPSGERAPLQRELRFSGRLWLGLGVVVLLVWISLFAFPATRTWWTLRDVEERCGVSVREGRHQFFCSVATSFRKPWTNVF